MDDFEVLAEKLMSLTPEQIEDLSSQLAADPNMAPPNFGQTGSLSDLMDQMEVELQGALKADPTMAGGTQVDNTSPPTTTIPGPGGGGQVSLGDILAGGQAAPQAPIPPTPQSATALADAAKGLQSKERNLDAHRPRTPYLANVSVGNASPAHGLTQGGPRRTPVPGLANLLRGR